MSTKLYESHKSFLSSPLLASIMLLTYEEFAEIPQKMHAFYGQAFDTLFQKHDASKEQYQRKTHTQLTREEFKECFAVFCALGYLEQKFSFSEDELLETATTALVYMRSASDTFPKSITPKQLIDDLFESVCMLQKDGIEVAFVHRSFQEYFSALFGRSLKGENLKKFFDRCTLRFGDTVIPMAADMAREVVEGEWVLPTVEDLLITLDHENPTTGIANKIRIILPGVYMMAGAGRVMVTTFGFDDAKYGAIEILGKLYPKHMPMTMVFTPLSLVSDEMLFDSIAGQSKTSRSYKAVESLLKRQKDFRNGMHSSRGHKPFMLVDQEDWWLEKVGISKSIAALISGLISIKKEVLARDKKKGNILLDFLKK